MENTSNDSNAEDKKNHIPRLLKEKGTSNKTRYNGKYDALWLILIIIATSAITLFIEWWQTGIWRKPVMVLVGVIIVLIGIAWVFRTYGQPVFEKIGVKKQDVQSLFTPLRFFMAGILATLFALYVLLPNPKFTIPSSLQFNVIVISATLGGLVLAGASNRRISRQANNKLISIAKKLIYATILFLVFTALLYWLEATGGIDANIPDYSKEGIIRGTFFYGGAASFYTGIFLFSIALIDLAFTLRNLTKSPNRRTRR